MLPGFSAQTVALGPITPSSSLQCEEGSLVVILLLLQSSPCKSLPPRQCPPAACLAAFSILPTVRPLGGTCSPRSARGPHHWPMAWMMEPVLREPWEGLLGKPQGCGRAEPAGPPGYQVQPFSFSGEEANWAEHSQIQEPPVSKKDHSKLYLLGSSFLEAIVKTLHG